MAYPVMQVAKMTFKEMGADDISGLAAELSYRFFLTLFPFFIFLAALGGIVARMLPVDNPTERIMNELTGNLPADAESLLRGQLDEVVNSRNGAVLSLGVVGAIWAASSAVGTVTKALNRAYDVEETRPFWKRYLLNLGITLLAGAALVVVVIVMLAGQFFSSTVAGWTGFGESAGPIISLLRWPALVAILLAVAAFLYWAAPNAKLPFRFISPGAVAYVIAWLIASAAFGFYVANFGSYNATYGALGAVVILLLWFYLSALVFLAGAELNAVLDTLAARRREPDSPERPDARRTPEQQRESRAGSPAREHDGGYSASPAQDETIGATANRASKRHH